MPTILCIDDVLQGLALRKSVLESHGYEVLTTSDGLRGIDIARTRRIDAVLLDYDMPGMMGDEVAEVLKKAQPGLPIILLTGFRFGIPETLLRTCDKCVEKGEGTTALLNAIEMVLKQRPKPMKPPADEAEAV